MKNIFLLFATVCLSLTACNKEVAGIGNTNDSVDIIPASAVPNAVLASFNSSFSTASEVEWQHNSDVSFTCQFNMDDKRHEAHFDDNGHQSGHSIICLDAAVPANVLDAFRNSFPKDIVYEWKLASDNTWKAHFMRGAVKWEVTLDSNGNVLKTENE